jgi:hypothetical protein
MNAPRPHATSLGNPYLYLAGFLFALAFFLLVWPSTPTRAPSTPAPSERLTPPPPYTAPPQVTGAPPAVSGTAPAAPPVTEQPVPRGVHPDLHGDLQREDDHHPARITQLPDEPEDTDGGKDRDKDHGRIGDGEIDLWRWLT